jgi:hypothetical protein
LCLLYHLNINKIVHHYFPFRCKTVKKRGDETPKENGERAHERGTSSIERARAVASSGARVERGTGRC